MADIDYNLSILNSNVFYDKLDRASDDYRFNSEEYWNYIIQHTCINKTSIFDTLLKGFYYVSYMKMNEIFLNNRWNFLYFWAGSKVLENIEGCSLIDIVYIVKSVRKHIQQDDYNSYIDDINPEEFKELKIVYDFLVNYDSIKLSIGAHNSDCTKKYKEYVDSSFEAYEKLKAKCTQYREKGYCKMFNDFVQINKYENLEKLTCHGNMPPLSVEDKKREFSSYKFPEGDSKDKVNTGETSASSESYNLMSTFFPILGIFSIFFLLYNYTPFRTWLHNILSKNERIRHNLYEDDTVELFENEYESSDRNGQYIRHDINYHSIINA
ncbi:PIR Superfamily Protein [Plasmodium ovale curtisi]|uniref:PIR Superfamily Protein n=1 Tax=Plasmodium ovale curtisi TaxID=864141 RepID=A0A1A8XFX2_PLAOA|nr:PIR Superfamily Protein [Plasmodium ovale curtisi]